jgi:hypothetical protein
MLVVGEDGEALFVLLLFTHFVGSICLFRQLAVFGCFLATLLICEGLGVKVPRSTRQSRQINGARSSLHHRSLPNRRPATNQTAGWHQYQPA